MAKPISLKFVKTINSLTVLPLSSVCSNVVFFLLKLKIEFVRQISHFLYYTYP